MIAATAFATSAALGFFGDAPGFAASLRFFDAAIIFVARAGDFAADLAFVRAFFRDGFDVERFEGIESDGTSF